ncbi:MAG TPA: hypothetical protein VKE69_00730, partial [Planctomycetota bacterium]|nr:hypothetical protein [Planctomycetota bacterium]
MNRLLAIVVAALLASLLILQIAHAARRIRAISDRTAEDALSDLRGEVARQAARMEDDLALGKAHARYVASLQSVRALLDGGPADVAARAGQDVASILRHFPSFGGVVVLDAEGDERLRVERMGGGVAIVPDGLLREHSDEARAKAALRLAPDEVSLSPLEFDSSRVDVAEEDRLVLRYVARVDSRSPGAVVLSLYAAPLFEATRQMEPIPG